MVLLVNGQRVLHSAQRDKSNKDWRAPQDHECVKDFVAALTTAAEAFPADKPTLVKTPEPTVVAGEDTSLIVVLQREAAAVAPPVTEDPQCPHPTKVCSIDATTCLVVAMRDPLTRRTVVAHFDAAGDQTTDGVGTMLKLLNRDEDEEAPPPVQLYLLGATQCPTCSENTLGALLRHVAAMRSVTFDADAAQCCVWSQNLIGAKRIRHRGLCVDAVTGECYPVECDKRRAYPAGRLRALRLFASSNLLNTISLLPEESIHLRTMGGNHPFQRTAAAHILVRPFRWPDFPAHIPQTPLGEFNKMSTSPEWEPVDFAETLKGAMVFGALTKAIEVFLPNGAKPQPVAFRLEPSDDGPVWAQIAPVKMAAPEAREEQASKEELAAAQAAAELEQPDGDDEKPAAASNRYGL